MNAIAHRTERVLTQDGMLTLDHLPFHAGDAVEVIVLPAIKPAPGPEANRYPLRGMPVEYLNPFSPVGLDDWSVIRTDAQ